ncbi:PSP1 C-terminal conserved region-domain containing protein, partial [Rhodotorula toruloides]
LGRGVPLHAIPPDAPLCIVGFKAGRKDLFFCEDPNLHLEEGDLVIVEADRGRDVGKYLKSCTVDEVHKFQQHLVELALGQLANPAAQGAQGGMMGGLQGMGGMGGGAQGGGAGGAAGPAQLARMTKECQPKRIYGKAGPADTHALLAKAQDEVKALALVRSKVAQKGLPMEILDAEWQWDRRKLTFYYTADQRVDFRELVRELFRIWKTRVWLCVAIACFVEAARADLLSSIPQLLSRPATTLVRPRLSARLTSRSIPASVRFHSPL